MVNTFLENRYAKDKKQTDETKFTISKVELELTRLINSITNQVPQSTAGMSKQEKQNLEIRTAATQQAQVYFRKALRDLHNGARYLR